MNIKAAIKNLYSFKSNSFSLDDVGRRFSNTSVFGKSSNSAMSHVTVYACVRDKAESIGQLPVKLYRKNKDGTKELITSGREYRIFTKQPNDFMTAQDMKEMYETSMELNGNFYAYVNRNDRGSIYEVIPFRFQSNVDVQMDLNGNVYYTYVTNDGKSKIGFNDDEIMHIKLNSLDGIKGLSPIKCMAKSLNLGFSQVEHQTNLLNNGAMLTGVLSTDKVFADTSRADTIRDQFKEKYQGIANTGEVVMLDGGLKYSQLTLSPLDSQLLETMRLTREELCGGFRVPPRRIGASGTKDSNDVEQENKDYYRNSLMPLVTKYEDAWNDIIPDNMVYKLDESGFTRGDLSTQVTAFGELFKLTAISIDELRSSVGYEPVENGHLHAIDTNNITLGELKNVEAIQAEQRALNNPEPKEPETEEGTEDE